MSRTRRRLFVLLLVGLLGCVMILAVLLQANQRENKGTTILRELRRVPPTVRVSERAIVHWEEFRGAVAYATGERLVPRGVDEAQVVSDVLVKRGQRLDDGDIIATVEGSPVIVLEGGLPAYRTLRPGMSGPDVDQLHGAFKRIGLRCNCGRTLVRSELRQLKRYVFRGAKVALDQEAWQDRLPVSGVVWVRTPELLVRAVAWRRGGAAKGALASTTTPWRRVRVRSVSAESRVRVGQRTVVTGAKGRVWRTHVASVERADNGRRSLTLAGAPPIRLGRVAGVKIRTLAIRGRALMVPAAAVGTASGAEDQIVILRRGRQVIRRVVVLADLGGTLAVRGRGLRDHEDVVLAADPR